MYCKPIGATCRNDYDSYRWWHTKYFKWYGDTGSFYSSDYS